MRIRYALAVLASLIVFGSGVVYADIMLGGTAPKASQQPGTLLTAQTATTTAPVSSGAVVERAGQTKVGGTVTTTGAHGVHTNFACTGTSCGCKGAADCFDLGSRSLCDAKGMSCTGSDCTCAKKAQ